MKIVIRKSTPTDLALLLNIEKQAFQLYQQSSSRTLRLSLNSPFQGVWLAEVGQKGIRQVAGCLIVHFHKYTLRLYSVAVLPEHQGSGVGGVLLKHAENVARSGNYERISLEADAENRKLIEWYNKAGYNATELIADYYDEGHAALRMVKELYTAQTDNKIANVIVVSNPGKWALEIENVEVVSAHDYTSNTSRFERRNLRVFNLCNSFKYQTLGYYVSLLASAREHRAIPSVTTIRDMQDTKLIRSVADDIDQLIQKVLANHKAATFCLDVYFAQSVDPKYNILAQNIYKLFDSPLFRVHFSHRDKWEIRKIVPLSMEKVSATDLEAIQNFAKSYFGARRFHKKRLRPYKYDLAILVNPNEVHPPSDKKALQLFKKAANKHDFYTEFITRNDINRITEFDALFIRETTNVNSHTYQFARKAYAEGLVVIDDPWSILRCSNKIYLHERLLNNNLNTPETRVFYKGKIGKKELGSLQYPLILKQPDSAFSLGVCKVNNPEELKKRLSELFNHSDLIIGQAFVPSAFDWRIGVLDNQPLFACKYYMSAGHWQIYNWNSSEKDPSGLTKTLPIEEVPRKVITTALKAASLMGDGLYGVDLKEIDGKVFVIEVNDNPNIDSGIEDQVLGKALYDRIINSIENRIEMSRNIARFVNVELD
jgi:glutathione synthase/RimK-type ligase-like ATP-grasp enzyme/ribosomal protein S18 acetylase RimI-like enzyme